MCLAVFAVDAHARFPWVLAANRDEFFTRPAAPLHWWEATPGKTRILAGRDLQAGGTWLGLTREGRFGLLTNVRSGVLPRTDAPSRGQLVTQWLTDGEDAAELHQRSLRAGYNAFNLLVADWRQGHCQWLHPSLDAPRTVPAGVHGVSNGMFNEPWPKLTRLRSLLANTLGHADSLTAASVAEQLLAGLMDTQEAAEPDLPSTGVPLALERQLSPIFIRPTERAYGTRCSTVIVTERTAGGLRTLVLETSHAIDGPARSSVTIELDPWPRTAGLTLLR